MDRDITFGVNRAGTVVNCALFIMWARTVVRDRTFYVFTTIIGDTVC